MRVWPVNCSDSKLCRTQLTHDGCDRVRSTMFIVGPARQCKLMVKAKRIISLLVFFGCMALTLLVASRGGITSIIPCLGFAGCQFCAAVYYFMSFIVSDASAQHLCKLHSSSPLCCLTRSPSSAD